MPAYCRVKKQMETESLLYLGNRLNLSSCLYTSCPYTVILSVASVHIVDLLELWATGDDDGLLLSL
jgi:hypothetical protein